ncbi:MAG TPA: nicotinate-nucleotide--dimethylbenzimidazole phosphoribosyltransferase [Thermohalobaculum sp.]|nr:nicotinate-nucleotide--dimethylbenzimidazole phosphoribosyltransferase [Thermohalobaculum sp.]
MLDDLAIPPAAPGVGQAVDRALAAKAKPPGSLGRIEELARALAVAQGTEHPSADPARLVIAAGDHGLVAEGVSAWPQAVSALMVRTFLSGGAAANVFARTAGAEVVVVDAGLATEVADAPGLRRAGIRAGTRNAAREDALTADEVARALRFGAALADEAAADGVRVLALGEMGIGNTATAALIGHLVAGLDLGALTGPGAGLPPEGLTRKRAVLERVAARRPGPLGPAEALAAVGGLEVAVLAGLTVGAAAHRIAVLVDGFIATAAVLAALAARPEARGACIFAHRSGEPGHVLMLDHLGAEPLLDLRMRLGEGTGALLALPLLRAAAAMLAEMATLEDIGVAGPGAP